MNIDASFLRPGYQSDRKEGFYAEFDLSGQLTHFGYYKNGKPQSWVLNLSPELKRGCAQNTQEFSLEHKRRQDKEQADWHDTDYASDAELYRRWVESQIQDIYESIDSLNKTHPAFLCSFCGKGQTEVAKLIAGPQVFICNECIQLCNEILTEDAASSSPAE